MAEELTGQRLFGQTVEINDFRRCAIGVDKGTQQAITSSNGLRGSKFLVERAPSRYLGEQYNGNNGNHHHHEDSLLVAFRLIHEDNNDASNTSTNSEERRYLTIALYGDTVRTTITEAVANQTPLLPVHVPLIVDFLVDRPTDQDNFEGAGFNYAPMKVAPAAGGGDTATAPPVPTFLQVFRLERVNGRLYGIKSLFDTYWRSQHWNGTVSQSSHCLRDEQWTLHPVNDNNNSNNNEGDMPADDSEESVDDESEESDDDGDDDREWSDDDDDDDDSMGPMLIR